MTLEAPARVIATGMTIVAPVAISDDAVLEICTALEGPTLAAARWPKDDEALGVLAYGGAGELALAIVRRERESTVRARPDAASMLGAPVVDVVRVEVMLRPDETGPLVRAEAAIVAIAHEMWRRFGALAIDDLGQIYDPAEIARLAARSQPRALAFSYALGATIRAVNEVPLDILPPALTATDEREAPSDPSPDFVDDESVAFAIRGTHVPLMQLARITLALANDARTNPNGSPVFAHAPNVAAAEGLRLAAFGVDLAASLDLPPARRDELDVFARSLPVAEAIGLLREIVAGLVNDAGLFTTPPAIRDDGAPMLSGFPALIASFDLPGAALDVYHLDLATADDVFGRFVGMRAALTLMLSADVGSALALEFTTTPDEIGAETSVARRRAADAVATMIASAFVERSDGIACDASGTIYGGEELARLATRRLGHAESWSAKLATFDLRT